mgnify:CR=1 FL=1
MKNLRNSAILGVFALLSACLTANAQSPCDGVTMPAGTLCITQTAGNAAAQLARESALKDEKIKVLESGLVDKDKIIAENKATATKNEADLKAAMHSTEVKLATATGTLIGCEASNVRNLAIIDVLLKNVRPKKIGLINF